jgi:hypothetical protein
MTALSRLVGRALGLPVRLASPRIAFPALAAGLVIVSAAVVLLSPGSQQDGGQASDGGQATNLSGAPCPVPAGGTPLPLAPGPPRPQAECDAFAEEFAANERAAAASRAPTTPERFDFWGELFAVRDPAYRSLAEVGARSEAVVVGSFTGEVEQGREPCDEESLANGAPRGQACVFFANLPFRIDEILAGSLPERNRETVKLEYMVDLDRRAALAEVVPTDARIVLFIGSKELRDGGIQDVYYSVGVGKGTFRALDGRVVPLALPDDPQFGRLEGMPFEQFVELVRRVPILDLMPEG